MKRGKTEAETLTLNGWGVGDILEGEKDGSVRRILITAIGEELFMCRWDKGFGGDFGSEHGATILGMREWKKVGQK